MKRALFFLDFQIQKFIIKIFKFCIAHAELAQYLELKTFLILCAIFYLLKNRAKLGITCSFLSHFFNLSNALKYRATLLLLFLAFSIDIESMSPGITPTHQGEEIPFSFDKKPLVEIIEFLAKKRNINIVLPQLAAELDLIKKQTITYQPVDSETVSLDKAWALLNTFLELSGFSIFKKKSNLYAIIKNRPNEPDITKQPLPLFINTKPTDLPRTEQRIRYIYYLRNLRVPTPEDRDNPLSAILKEMLTQGHVQLAEPKSNALILVDRANAIASVMNIIIELDSSGFKETIEVVPLLNISVKEVISVFQKLKSAAGEEEARRASPFIRSEGRYSEGVAYFAIDTKFIADDRNNSLILMGRESAINRIREFIAEYMDVLPESGNSILHTYDLQYLNAREFGPILQKLVEPFAGPSGQATQAVVGGPNRFFSGVAVVPEISQEAEYNTPIGRIPTEKVSLDSSLSPGSTNDTPGIVGKLRTGGNRLVIAALHEDWIQVKELIAKLDKPQPQVILEVMIVDFTLTQDNLLASAIRNLTTDQCDAAGSGVQFLADNINSPLGVANLLGQTPRQLAADLLRLIASTATNQVQPITNFLSGSAVFAFNDPSTPGIFGLVQTLSRYVKGKVLSHPFLVTTNNQKATISSVTIRRTRGDAVPAPSGVIEVRIVDIPATIQVQMIPRLSSLERLSLQVAVDINEFIDPIAGFDRNTRRVNTNSNLQSGEILVIGGLTRVIESDTITQTPFFSQIPIIGNLFKQTHKTITKSSLAIFISPTIVHPKLRGGLDTYTAEKIRMGRRDIGDDPIFGDSKDPIVHVFFKTKSNADDFVNEYLTHTDNAPNPDAIKTEYEKMRELRRPRRKPKEAPKKVDIDVKSKERDIVKEVVA